MLTPLETLMLAEVGDPAPAGDTRPSRPEPPPTGTAAPCRR